MASRIAALQAKLGGGAMIMGGMKSGGHPGLRKKQQEKKQRRASLDNSALLDRTVVKGQRKRKKINIDFDELEDEKQEDETFAQLISGDIDASQVQPLPSGTAKADDGSSGATESPSASASAATAKKLPPMGGLNMKAMLAGAGGGTAGFKLKKGAKFAAGAKTPTSANKKDDDELPNVPFLQARNRTKSKSFTLGVTLQPLIDATELERLRADNRKMVADASRLLEVVSKKHGKRHVRLFAELDKYIACRAADKDGNGLQIESFRDNEYGTAMEEKGIKPSWRLTKIDKLDVDAMALAAIKEKVAAHKTSGGDAGYNVTFEGEQSGGGGAKTPTAATADEAKAAETPSITPAKDVFADAQKSSLKSDLVKEELGTKVVRLFDVYEKYFTATKGKDGKGVVIESVVDDGFEAHGIGIGWQLQKLGKRNVSKASFIMLRNQLMAQASTAKKFGYELTFIDTDSYSKKSSSQPSSPRGGANPTVTPSTAPFKPMPSPAISTPFKPMPSAAPITAAAKPVKAKTPAPKTQLRQTTISPKSTTQSPSASPSYKITPKKKAEIPTKALPGFSGLATASAISTSNTSNATKSTTSKPVPDEDDIAEKKFKKNRKSSYTAPKTCDLVEDGATQKQVRLFQEYSKFFSAKAGDGNKGFVVDTITNNEFGNAFKNMGIPAGWRVTRCGGKPVGNKMFAMLKNQVAAAGRPQDAQKNGYMVIFEATGAEQNNDDQKTGTSSAKPKPRNTGSSSSRPPCELVSDDDGGNAKTVRLHHSIEKYIKSAAAKGPKGYKIIEFSKMFGNDLQALGVQTEWKLTKLGAKDVSKAFFQMTKTNLDVEFRNNKNKGYVVTFSAPN